MSALAKFLVCMTLDGKHLSGSTISNCESCEAPVWVSPSGGPILADSEAIVLCVKCAMREMAADENIEIIPPNEQQLSELRRHFTR